MAFLLQEGEEGRGRGSGLFAKGGGGGTEPRGVACLLREGGGMGPGEWLVCYGRGRRDEATTCTHCHILCIHV